MTLLPVSDFLGNSAALCDAVVRLRGPALVAELGRIASAVMASPYGLFLPATSLDAAAQSAIFPGDTPALLQEISFDGHCFGHYRVAGRAYNDADRRHLASLASLTAGVLQVHALAQRSTHAYAQVEALLAQQTQILDQLHESVLTMDLTGYI
ncbi:MAG: GGDEF domain-containing protein, partial [Janthinobacterium sp.]